MPSLDKREKSGSDLGFARPGVGTPARTAGQEATARALCLAPLALEEAVICKGVANRAPLEPGEKFESSGEGSTASPGSAEPIEIL